jgi:hypothetical protein
MRIGGYCYTVQIRASITRCECTAAACLNTMLGKETDSTLSLIMLYNAISQVHFLPSPLGLLQALLHSKYLTE